MKMSLHKCKDTCHHHNCCNYIPHTYRFQQPYMYDATSGFSTSHHPSHIFVYDLWQRKLKSDKEHCIKHYLIRYLTTGTKFLYFYDKKVIMTNFNGNWSKQKRRSFEPRLFCFWVMITTSVRCTHQKQSVSFCLSHGGLLILYDH